MSFVTSVVVVSLGEQDAIDYINRALRAVPGNRGQALAELNQGNEAGGFNALGYDIYAAAFDYIDTGSLITALKSAPWRSPGMVTVHYCSDFGESAIWNAGHGTLHHEPVREPGFVSSDPFKDHPA